MVHYNPNWKQKIHDEELTKNGIELRSMTDAISCMGCFYTVTPRLLTDIGGFDEISFPIRGHSHIDFTMRACRNGSNDINTLYDIKSATEYIDIHPKEGYVSTFRRYSYTEQMLMADPQDKARRWSLIKEEERLFVELALFEMLEPEKHHLMLDSKSSVDLYQAKNIHSIGPDRDTLQRRHQIPEGSVYNPLERWSMKENQLILKYKDMQIWWKMPPDFSFEDTHPDLFKLAEFVLLSPYQKRNTRWMDSISFSTWIRP